MLHYDTWRQTHLLKTRRGRDTGAFVLLCVLLLLKSADWPEENTPFNKLHILKCSVYFGRYFQETEEGFLIKLERRCWVWTMRECFTNSRRAEEEEYERMLFIVPTVLLPPDGYTVQIEGERKAGLLFHSFAFVDFAFALSFTQLNRVDLRAAGIPETMIKEWQSRDEKRVRDIWWKKKEKEERKQSKRARWETSRKLPTMPLFPPQSVGPLASGNCVSLPGAAMAKSV